MSELPKGRQDAGANRLGNSVSTALNIWVGRYREASLEVQRRDAVLDTISKCQTIEQVRDVLEMWTSEEEQVGRPWDESTGHGAPHEEQEGAPHSHHEADAGPLQRP